MTRGYSGSVNDQKTYISLRESMTLNNFLHNQRLAAAREKHVVGKPQSCERKDLGEDSLGAIGRGIGGESRRLLGVDYRQHVGEGVFEDKSRFSVIDSIMNYRCNLSTCV